MNKRPITYPKGTRVKRCLDCVAPEIRWPVWACRGCKKRKVKRVLS
jgi:hypothetical protein